MNSACSSVIARCTWWQGYLAECISARFSKSRSPRTQSISRRMSQLTFKYDTIKIEQQQITSCKLNLLPLSRTISVAGVVLEDIANLECGSVPHGRNFSSIWSSDLTKPINSRCLLSCAQRAHAHPWKHVFNVPVYYSCWRRTLSGQSRRSTTIQFTSLKLRHWHCT